MKLSTASLRFADYQIVNLDRTIDPCDIMWQSGQEWYWPVGLSGLECVLKGLLQCPLEEPGSILDLACGHGRVGRHLVACFPRASFYWCDVDGAEFCARQFGGRAIQASPELLETPLPATDVVWVGSLFTHVAENRAQAWLKHIASTVNPGGVIVATFHGRTTGELYRSVNLGDLAQLSRVEAEAAANGWGFEAYEPDKDPGWGLSSCTLGKLATIAAEVPGTRVVGLVEGGWSFNQDVLTLLRTPAT